MDDQYMKYPTTIKTLAGEIKTICNDYNARKITNDQIREIMFWYANKMPEMLFAADNINPTVAAIIGKKRIKLLTDLLDGYQQRIGGGL